MVNIEAFRSGNYIILRAHPAAISMVEVIDPAKEKSLCVKTIESGETLWYDPTRNRLDSGYFKRRLADIPGF